MNGDMNRGVSVNKHENDNLHTVLAIKGVILQRKRKLFWIYIVTHGRGFQSLWLLCT